MAEYINRPGMKAEMNTLLKTAQVSPKKFFALYLLVASGLNVAMAPLMERFSQQMLSTMMRVSANPYSAGVPAADPGGFSGLPLIFILVLVSLVQQVLAVAPILYAMAVRRGRRAGYATLFEGFSFVGKIVGLMIVEAFFVYLWTLLFIVPGFIAAYRYTFAIFNLCENPELGIMEALRMSKAQTKGYKMPLFVLALSYFGWRLLASLGVGLATVLYRNSPTMAMFVVGTAMTSLWELVVSLFWMPTYYCVQVGYFETAKRTSGVGLQDAPPLNELGGGAEL